MAFRRSHQPTASAPDAGIDASQSGSSLDALIAGAARFHGVPDAADAVRLHVESMLAHGTTARVRATTGRRFSELGVMGTIDGVVSVGSIDVAWEEGDRLVLSDYKTEYGDRAELDERYRPQLDTYRALLAAATGRPVDNAGVIHLGPRPPDPGDPAPQPR